MPSVFTDEVGTYDLAITTSANWTITAADLPNGDPAASLSTTLNQNAVWAGEDFCLPVGSGSEARTFECWIKATNSGTYKMAGTVRTNGTATTGTNRHWDILLAADFKIYATWYNTSGTTYLQQVTGTLGAGWLYVVVVFNCGSTRSITTYINTSINGPATTTSGTPTQASSDTYEFYMGAARTDATTEMTDHIAKVAWYERALTGSEMSAHYLAMTAT